MTVFKSTKSALGALAGLVLASCASPGTPPGAPERLTPPSVVQWIPDSGTVDVDVRHAVVEFDAVVSETPKAAGARELRDLVTISPRHGDIDVDWRRSSLRVRPKNGWKKNTTYTVTLAPGISDLQNNTRDSTSVLVFSTGSSIDAGFLNGTVYDWATGNAAVGAVVEAVPASDSASIYITRADSSGKFRLRVPSGASYLIRTSINRLGDKVFDPRMAYDTATKSVSDSSAVDLFAFERDTIGPALGTIAHDDSTKLVVSFTGYLHPDSVLKVSQFQLFDSDSVLVAIDSVKQNVPGIGANDTTDTAARGDSVVKRDTVVLGDPLIPRDTTVVNDTTVARNRADSLTTDSSKIVPRMPRRQIVREITIFISARLKEDTEYVLKANGIVNPNGALADSRRSFKTPPKKKQ